VIGAAIGVLLSPDDAATLVNALDLLKQVLAERRDQHGNRTPADPSNRLEMLTGQLRKASRKCAAFNAIGTRSVTNAGSSSADQPDTTHDRSYATVGSSDAARILGVTPHAVSTMALRDPSRLGSRRVGGRWRHDLARVEHRAAKRRVVPNPELRRRA
jgi:hypothetical protein